MKKLFLILLCVSVLSSPVFADVISLRADEWCPYNCEPGSEKPGYMIEIATVVFEKAGHTLDYQLLNWSRSIVDSRQGKYTGIIGTTKDEAPDFIFPEEPLGSVKDVFWVKKGTAWRYQGIESLTEIRLGVIQDYVYSSINSHIEQYKTTSKVQESTGDDALEKNIKKLELGRIDALLEDQNVFQNIVKDMGKLELFEVAGDLSEASEEEHLYIAFSPASPKSDEYAKILSEGIKQLRASGELQKILSNYGLNDWK